MFIHANVDGGSLFSGIYEIRSGSRNKSSRIDGYNSVAEAVVEIERERERGKKATGSHGIAEKEK